MSFPADQVYCVLDYETFSEAPLKKTGGFEYSVHPSTEIICAAWRIGTREELKKAYTQWWAPNFGDSGGGLSSLLKALRDPSVIMVAHNALFEQMITRNVFATKYMGSKREELQSIPVSRWLCTASLAAVLALPRRLEGAASALKLPTQKDKEGHKLILKWCKPRKPTKKNPNTRHTGPVELKRIIDYCVTDVGAEVELFLKLPPLSDKERAIWELDQKINLRGFLVDRPLVKTILSLIEKESAKLNADTDELTFGKVLSATQRDGVLNWLSIEGITLENLTKKTVEDALKFGDVQGDARRMLELRLAISKTSTAKYQAFELRSRHDSRLRDILLFSAASTRRWGGMGVQPQNFPRGSIKDTVQASSILREGDLELIRLIYGEPMNVFSSCLRNMIIAPKGKVLDVADYAAIETRVLFWFARHEEGLKAFREERDLYCEMAGYIFRESDEDIRAGYKAGDVQAALKRFVGKGVILGCGYNMGGEKFKKSCSLQGQEIEQDLADQAVATYRNIHAPVVKLWKNIELAAIAAVKNPGKKYTINRTSWYVRNGFLFCDLPSGGRLAYYGPTVRYRPTPWGETKPALYHWGTNTVTKQWEEQGTYGGKLVENVVQATSRDIMAEAMLRIEACGPWEIVLSVHDELLAERDLLKNGSNKEFISLMAEVPDWAEGCPIKVEGWEGTVYRK